MTEYTKIIFRLACYSFGFSIHFLLLFVVFYVLFEEQSLKVIILTSFLKYGWFSFGLSVSSCFYLQLKHEFQPDMSLTSNFSSSPLFLCSLPVCDNNLLYNILEKLRFSKISFLYISFQFCYHSSCLLCWSWINYKEKSNKNMPYGRYFFRKQSIQLKLVKYPETR